MSSRDAKRGRSKSPPAVKAPSRTSKLAAFDVQAALAATAPPSAPYHHGPPGNSYYPPPGGSGFDPSHGYGGMPRHANPAAGPSRPPLPTVVDSSAADIKEKLNAFSAVASSLSAAGTQQPSAIPVALVPPPAAGGLTLVPPGGSSALTLVPPGGSHQLSLVAPNSNDKRAKHTQLARESRRILAQNFPRGVTQDMIRERILGWCDILRRRMIEEDIGSPLPTNAIVEIDAILDVYLTSNVAAPYAFIEFSTDDMPTAFLQLAERHACDFHGPDGIYKLNIKRPSHYKPLGKADPRRVMALGISSPDESKETLEEIFSAFGKVAVFAIIPGRGVYVEYEKESVAAAAIKALHGQDIGDRIISVQAVSECMRFHLASLGVPVSNLEDDLVEEVLDPKKETMKMLFNFQNSLTQSIHSFIQSVDHLSAVWPLIVPTRILALFNMIDPEELEDDKEFHALLSDIAREVEKYGRVKQVIIPRTPPAPPKPPAPLVKPEKPKAPLYPDEAMTQKYNEEVAAWQTETESAQAAYDQAFHVYKKARDEWDKMYWDPLRGNVAVGRVFVEYESVDEAAEAQRSIAGRLFNGRTIVTSFLFEDILYPPSDPDAQVDEQGCVLMLEEGSGAAGGVEKENNAASTESAAAGSSSAAVSAADTAPKAGAVPDSTAEDID